VQGGIHGFCSTKLNYFSSRRDRFAATTNLKLHDDGFSQTAYAEYKQTNPAKGSEVDPRTIEVRHDELGYARQALQILALATYYVGHMPAPLSPPLLFDSFFKPDLYDE
jgi:hypothetical protein